MSNIRLRNIKDGKSKSIFSGDEDRRFFVSHRIDRYAEWIEITDEDNKKSYCFPIQRWIDKGENDKQTDVYFTEVSDLPCDLLPDTMPETGRRSIPTTHQAATGIASPLTSQSQASAQTPTTPFKSAYHVKTKTGKKGFLGLSPTGKIQ